MNKKELNDMQRMFQCMLSSPYAKGDTLEFDGTTPLKSFEGKNMDVKSLMGVNLVNKFMKTGDPKIFEVIMKYAGLEPPKESNVTVELPTIIDDLSDAPAEKKHTKIGLDIQVYDDPNESADR